MRLARNAVVIKELHPKLPTLTPVYTVYNICIRTQTRTTVLIEENKPKRRRHGGSLIRSLPNRSEWENDS